MSARRVAVVLVVGLLLAGCSASPTDADSSISPTSTIGATPSTSGTPPAGTTPMPSPTDWSEFVTVDSDDSGLAPDGWTTYGPVIAWAEQYCEMEGLSPCEGLADRAVPLCIERRDCHPAVLVPFEEGAVAFVAGGVFPQPQVIGVWHPEGDPRLAPYGGARKLLEAYLASVEVYPNAQGQIDNG